MQNLIKVSVEGWPYKLNIPPVLPAINLPEGGRGGRRQWGAAGTPCDPLLTILSRANSRVVENEREVVQVAREEGFAVRVIRPQHDSSLQVRV